MIQREIGAKLLAAGLTLAGLAMAADPDVNILKNSGSLDRLFKQSGVYHASSTGKTPSFVIDAAWPQPLPNNWLLGRIGGLYVDHNRARTLTTRATPRKATTSDR